MLVGCVAVTMRRSPWRTGMAQHNGVRPPCHLVSPTAGFAPAAWEGRAPVQGPANVVRFCIIT